MYSTLYPCHILMTLVFLYRLSKNFGISHFMKILPVGAELFYADRQTGMTKLTVAFRYFENAPKKAVGSTSLSWHQY